MRTELVAAKKVRRNARYDEKRVKEYIQYNIEKINGCLRESLTRDLESNHSSCVNLATQTLEALQIYIAEIAHLMVGIRKNEERLSRSASQGLAETLTLEATVAKLMIGEKLALMAYFVLAKRKNHIFLSAENLIAAIESLPRKDFYVVFKGTTYKKMQNRH